VYYSHHLARDAHGHFLPQDAHVSGAGGRSAGEHHAGEAHPRDAHGRFVAAEK